MTIHELRGYMDRCAKCGIMTTCTPVNGKPVCFECYKKSRGSEDSKINQKNIVSVNQERSGMGRCLPPMNAMNFPKDRKVIVCDPKAELMEMADKARESILLGEPGEGRCFKLGEESEDYIKIDPLKL